MVRVHIIYNEGCKCRQDIFVLQLLSKNINLLASCISLQFLHNDNNSTFISLKVTSSLVHVFHLLCCSFK